MINSALFMRIRVRVAQITFFLLFLYCFVLAPVTIDPLTSSKGIIGAVVMVLGTLIRTLSAGFISKNKFLASSGLYALTRNPLYFGSFTALLGLNIIIWDPLFAAVTFILFAVTYIPTILREEAGLAKVFPEQWPEFKRGTPRFFPALWRLKAYGEISWDYAQWRRNREYKAIIAVAAILIALHWYALRQI